VKDIDNLVSFFDHRLVHYALMHCVAIYPTPVHKLQLNQVESLRLRYPHVPIGFSTHESPDNLDAVKIARAKGAVLFERHVGIGTSKIKLNAYSSTPAQVNKWIESWKEADVLCGAKNRTPGDHSETSSLASLMRGVYARKKIRKGRPVRRADVFFAMPLREGQMTSGEWKDDCVADRDYAAREAISEQIARRRPTKKEIVYQSIHEIKGMLNEARIAVGTEFTVELSHHYGIEHFRETGATIIDCINRAYCKKIIVLLPGQKHPYHYHRKKEETFQVLAGEMVVEMEGRPRKMLPGDLLTVQPGVWHKFQSDSGVMFEEVSTTHLNDDSFYEDKYINQVGRDERKTRLINWGMHQFD
jgi:N-acetylneuraminate synthase